MSAKTKSKKPKASKAKSTKPKGNLKPKTVKAAPAPKPKAEVKPKPTAERKETKMDIVISLLKRADGATIEQIASETNWQKHTIRSAISHGLVKKRGFKVESDKAKGEQRVYKIVD